MGADPKNPGSGATNEYELFVVNGDWSDDADDLFTDDFTTFNFRAHLDNAGFRCARDR
jgi:hypothetical protein